MQRFKKTLALLLALTLAFALFAGLDLTASAETDGIFTYEIEDEQAIITKCDYAASGSIEIPDALGGYPVTAIAKSAFYDRTEITDITIPDSVVYIGKNAFIWCAALTDVTIPDSVEWIDEYAFYGCSELASVEIANGIIGDMAFGECTGLKSVTFGEGVTTIGNRCFYGCTGLTGISIPSSVTFIDIAAFDACTGLIDISVESDNPQYHSEGNCVIETESQELIIGCKTSVIPLDGSVTTISYYAFIGCVGLTTITIPDTITSIYDYAFSGCTGLGGVNFGNGVSYIGYHAFKGCTGLSSISIPKCVNSINECAFSGCTGLVEITVDSANPDYHSAGNCLIKNKSLITGCNTSVIPNDGSVTAIVGDAFKGCTGLTSITIPVSVTSIGSFAFYGCTGLTDVYYSGNQSDWENIFGIENSFKNATVHYDEMTSEHEHSFGNWTVTKVATCTEKGEETRVCSYDEDHIEIREIEELGHDFGDWTVTKAATCTEKGKETRVCSRDASHTETREISALGHNYASVVTAPTCTEQGYTTYTCKNCGDSYAGDYVEAKHTIESVPAKEATTSQAGNMAHFRCTVCGKVFDDPYAQIEMSPEAYIIPQITTKYTITYNLNGGKNNSANPKSYSSTGEEIILKNPTRSGYTFKGWYSDAKLTKKVTKIAANATGDKIFYAKWEKTYTITYKLNSGTNNTANPKTYTKIDSTIALKNPTRKGYTFKGWYSDAKFKKKVTKIAKGSTGNKTLYAKWAKNTYKITYKLNSGKNNAKNPKTYTVTTATITLKNPTRKGYTFMGWYSNAKFTKKVTKIAKGSTGNKTLYAKWKKK